MLTARNTSPTGDLARIRRTVNRLNTTFRAGVASGIAGSEVANYWVGSGVYTADQCAAFEAARGEGVVAETIVVHADTLRPTPGWVDPVIGRTPRGRIYAMVIDEIQTLVPTGEQRVQTFVIHATVRPDGRARLFFRCA